MFMVFVDLELRKAQWWQLALLHNVRDVSEDDAVAGRCLKWLGAGRAGLEDPLWRWPLHSQEWPEHPTRDLSSMAITELSLSWLKAPRTCVSRNQGKAASFVMTQPQKPQVYQRIYSHTANWCSSCENSDATSWPEGFRRKEFAG